MPDENPISSHAPGEVPRVTMTGLSIDGEMAETTVLSLHQLQSAFVELSIALYESLRDERGSAAACLQRAQATLKGLDRMSPSPSMNGAPRGLARWQIRRVLTHIDANLGMSIRNKDLAILARLSKFHFNVAFRKSIGHSPHEYVIRRRMQRAQGLMLSTNKPLSQIAAECGLADQPHFTRLFRRFVGESPAAWRRARAHPGR